jgi:hypothetical protein
MGARPWRGRLFRRTARAVHRAARALGDAGQRLADRLAYRPREVVVVALLAAGLFGGLMIERWRAHHPATADRLELEPVRPASLPSARAAPRLRARSIPARCEEPGGTAVPPQGVGPRLDLNRASPGELARLAGISWRLAARIVSAREVFEGRETPRGVPDDDRVRVKPSEPEAHGTTSAAPTPDVDAP